MATGLLLCEHDTVCRPLHDYQTAIQATGNQDQDIYNNSSYLLGNLACCTPNKARYHVESVSLALRHSNIHLFVGFNLLPIFYCFILNEERYES